MTEADSDIIKPEMLKAYVWLRTSDDSIQQVEQEVAMYCPFICQEIHTGMGSSKNYPISLPSRVNLSMLSLILDYCRFHQVSEQTSAADSLQLKPLVDLTSRALALVIEGKTPEEIRVIFHLPDDLTEVFCRCQQCTSFTAFSLLGRILLFYLPFSYIFSSY